MKKIFMAAYVLGIVAAFMGLSACNGHMNVDEGLQARAAGFIPDTQEDENGRTPFYSFVINCVTKPDGSVHNGKSEIIIKPEGSDEVEKTFTADVKSTCTINRTPDTVRVARVGGEAQNGCSIARNYKGDEYDTVRISVSDGRILTLPYMSEHAADEKYMGVTYRHGYDSLYTAELVGVKQTPISVASVIGGNQYIKEAYATRYFVEVKTQGYMGNGEAAGEIDRDTLETEAITLVLADNTTTDKLVETGSKVLNETQQHDSAVVERSWADGHKERMVFNNIRNRSIQKLDKREFFVASFDNQTAGESFTRVNIDGGNVRSDANWTVNYRKTAVNKMASVDNNSQEVSYTLYQEEADFKFGNISHHFDFVDWEVGNYADNFKPALISSKADHDELDYKNEVRTSYLGYVQFVEEEIAWFKQTIKIVDYDYVNGKRNDYPTYTEVSLDEIAIYSDGSTQKTGSYIATIPVSVNPLTHWIINTNVWGVYTSGAFNGTQTAKAAKVAEKFFFYNQFTYRFANNVSGEENALSVSVPNEIVFKKGNKEYKFADSDLQVIKKNENTAMKSSTTAKSVYDYTCTAGITFGEASTEVQLPGTINLDTRSHDHGKIVATHLTSTPNEDRSFYKNVAVIVFEDGYRQIGMAENSAMEFVFTMSSTTPNVNSAVYADGSWQPSIAEDNSGLRCMLWRNEAGSIKRTLDTVTATAQRWNNGHNTIVDPRREGKISADGYSVTFYLNGIAGQTLDF